MKLAIEQITGERSRTRRGHRPARCSAARSRRTLLRWHDRPSGVSAAARQAASIPDVGLAQRPRRGGVSAEACWPPRRGALANPQNARSCLFRNDDPARPWLFVINKGTVPVVCGSDVLIAAQRHRGSDRLKCGTRRGRIRERKPLQNLDNLLTNSWKARCSDWRRWRG